MAVARRIDPMAFMIVTFDAPGKRAVRDAHRAAHYAFLEAHQDRIIASGGLRDDEDQEFIGGLILLDVPTRAEAVAFTDHDPFQQAGLFGSVTITRWRKAFFDFKRV